MISRTHLRVLKVLFIIVFIIFLLQTECLRNTTFYKWLLIYNAFSLKPAGCLDRSPNGFLLIIRRTFGNCQHFNYANVRLIVGL